jgi:beta-mannanase
VCRGEHVQNVTWAYRLDAQPEPVAAWNTMSAYYPGDDDIDWIGLSVYGAETPSEEWQSFEQVMDGAYAEFAALAPSKPHGVFESGVTEGADPVAKATWLHDALESIKSGRYPIVKAMCYWHET